MLDLAPKEQQRQTFRQKGPGLDETPESHQIGTEEAIPLWGRIFQVSKRRRTLY